MRREIAIVALFVAACAHARNIDEHTAIYLGMKACINAWGKIHPIDVRLANPGFWRARTMGNHWKVWFGEEGQPAMLINVPDDARPPDGETCQFFFQDRISN
jgi:hypothetical protein